MGLEDMKQRAEARKVAAQAKYQARKEEFRQAKASLSAATEGLREVSRNLVPAPSPATDRQSSAQVETITYKKTKDFDKDAAKRFADGWTLQAETQSNGRVTVTRFVMLGGIGALAFKKGRGLTVTWTKGVS